MAKARVASSPARTKEQLSVFDCASIAEDLERELDGVATIIDRCFQKHDDCPDPAVGLIEGKVLDLARDAERTKDALYTRAKKAAA